MKTRAWILPIGLLPAVAVALLEQTSPELIDARWGASTAGWISREPPLLDVLVNQFHVPGGTKICRDGCMVPTHTQSHEEACHGLVRAGGTAASGLVFLCLAALLGVVEVSAAPRRRYAGARIDLLGLGKVELTRLLIETSETQLYLTEHPGVVAKVFDLECGKADEVSYGPYMSFAVELANFEDVLGIEELRPFVPAYYGANIDREKKYAFVAMEYLQGENLNTWCNAAAKDGYASESTEELREAICEALSIISIFHKHRILLIDFKPDNIIRLPDRRIKFVDLGALFTPRHRRDMEKYVYSATPDHAEVLIDASNLQAGVPPSEASDIFSAGVAMFEMATGTSRLAIEGHAADDIQSDSAIYLFRDSQIRDVWQAYPHLKGALPLLATQLKERSILFADLWYLLKGYVASKQSDWNTLTEPQQEQIILATGTTFIMEQLPSPLQWLAGPIARATVLRSLRLKTITELSGLLAHPVAETVRMDIHGHNCFIRYLQDLGNPEAFVEHLNTWQVRLDPGIGRWTIGAAAACAQLADAAPFTFLKPSDRDEEGHRYYYVVCDFEAENVEGKRLTVWDLRNDHFAWLG
jgi:serine/threonine protein kinase